MCVRIGISQVVGEERKENVAPLIVEFVSEIDENFQARVGRRIWCGGLRLVGMRGGLECFLKFKWMDWIGMFLKFL